MCNKQAKHCEYCNVKCRRNRAGRATGGERASCSACSRCTGSRARSSTRKRTCVPSAKRSCSPECRPPVGRPTRTFRAPDRWPDDRQRQDDRNSCCTRSRRRTVYALRAATCTTCIACRSGSTSRTRVRSATGCRTRQMHAVSCDQCRPTWPHNDEPLAI